MKSRLKIIRPPKYVLVKYAWQEGNADMFVLERETWKLYVAQAKRTGREPSVMVAESDDPQELKRFRKLTEES